MYGRPAVARLLLLLVLASPSLEVRSEAARARMSVSAGIVATCSVGAAPTAPSLLAGTADLRIALDCTGVPYRLAVGTAAAATGPGPSHTEASRSAAQGTDTAIVVTVEF